MRRVYLDHAATTAVRPDVLDAMLPYFGAHNPSSAHAEGRAARAALDDARERVAAVLGAKPKEIVFTGSGSEADTLAVRGVALARAERGRRVVTSAIEHHAVLHAAASLRDDGFSVDTVPVTGDGAVGLEAFAAALRDDTVLASVMYVNNELGTIAPVRELASAARERGVVFHTDAVQGAPFLDVSAAALGVDLLTIAAHKFGGPKGVGALYVRDGTAIAPVLHGGGQERGRRAGTENIAGIVGLAKALELARGERAANAARVEGLRDGFETALAARVEGVRFNGGSAPRAPHISNVSIAGVDSEALLLRLDLDGIAVSAGSACAAGAIEPSHVIAALGLPEEWMRGVLRVSLGPSTTQAEIERALQALERAVADLRSAAGYTPPLAFR